MHPISPHSHPFSPIPDACGYCRFSKMRDDGDGWVCLCKKMALGRVGGKQQGSVGDGVKNKDGSEKDDKKPQGKDDSDDDGGGGV
jgi:hypothetical protein